MPGGGEAAPGQRRHAAPHLAAARSAQYVAPATQSQPGVTVDTVSDRDSQTFEKTGSPTQRHNMI